MGIMAISASLYYGGGAAMVRGGLGALLYIGYVGISTTPTEGGR